MAEKKIHYCWFGGNELPDFVKKCIDSWKKYLPDYEIICWNESNFDVEICQYVKEAYEAKKWAFVSDYARMYVLYNHGGLYFDTDVELIRPINTLIEKGPFMARESSFPEFGVNSGLVLYAEKGMPVYREIMDDYEKSHFVQGDGTNSYFTVVERVTNILKTHGLTNEDKVQKVAGVLIYPRQYFCPLDYDTGKLNVTEQTYAIHWYSATWMDEAMQHRRDVCTKFNNIFPKKIAKFLGDWYVRFSKLTEMIRKREFDVICKKIKRRFVHK